MNLVIDEGNSRVKLAVFQGRKLIDLQVAKVEDATYVLKTLQKNYIFSAVIISSVTDEIKEILEEFNFKNSLFLTSDTPVPFKNLYKTPKTLGVDRIALVAATQYENVNTNTLVIDAGTCITYDFINSENSYLGGAIAPGLQMRYKSLYTFTKKLPILETVTNGVDLIGGSTNESMHSGVLNGMMFEIDGVINSYKQKFGDVHVILTGGDANFLCKQLKNSIFVNPNFLLEGLNEILIYQNNNETNHK